MDSEQQELQDLEGVLPNSDDIKVFSLERVLKIEDLNLTKDKQVVCWGIVGGFIGLMLGMIISRPFKRKKIK